MHATPIRVGLAAPASSNRKSRRRILPMLKAFMCTCLLILAASAPALAQTPCEGLTSLKLPDATITSARTVATGPYLPAGLPANAAQYAKIQLPAHCRVAAVLTPTADSHIEIELW